MIDSPAPAGGLPLLKAVARIPLLPALLLLGLSLAMFVPGVVDLPLTDRDEALFVQATRQMHETGDYFDIRFQDEPRYKKPIGIYWLQAAATAPFGGADAPLWAYRLPSQAAAVGSVLLTYLIGAVLFGPGAAFVGAMLFASTILLGVEARLAKTDGVLLFLVLAAQAVLAAAWMRFRSGRAPARAPAGDAGPVVGAGAFPIWAVVAFWVAVGLGILVKGPVILLVSGLTLAALLVATRSFALARMLRPLWGLLIVVVLVAPWLVAIGIASDGAFFREALGRDFLGKIATAQERHGAPPGAYLLAFLGTAWPMVPFVLLASPLMLWRWREPAILFCLLWIVPAWVAFEAVPTKLPHYVLPLYPALGLLAGAALVRGGTSALRGWVKALAVLLPLAPVVLGTAAIGLLLFVERRLPAWTDLSLLAAILASVWAARAFWQGRLQAAVILAVAASMALQAGVYAFALPAFQTVWLSPRIVAEARQATGCEAVTLAAVGYTEPSLVFFAGTGTRRVTPQAAAEWLAERHGDCALAAIERAQAAAFEEAAAGLALEPERVGAVDGFNYNRGRSTTILLYRVAGQP
ncbi:ArnT family glycosyltransferase [Faunimonas sp. B44]|uniref:ArnT family glycosyltransferase n=1 Tax=Faunimonas sp. B44 TaxID=3461493 RepID=UPI00404507FC